MIYIKNLALISFKINSFNPVRLTRFFLDRFLRRKTKNFKNLSMRDPI